MNGNRQKFIMKNLEFRNNASSKLMKSIYKLMSNALFGKLLFRARKNATETKLVTNPERFRRLARDPFLKECFPISENRF